MALIPFMRVLPVRQKPFFQAKKVTLKTGLVAHYIKKLKSIYRSLLIKLHRKLKAT